MYGFAILVGMQIDRQIDWLSANCARYFGGRMTTHNASFGRSQVAYVKGIRTY
jgi:hypothetical protein